jgi:hypothetical protein
VVSMRERAARVEAVATMRAQRVSELSAKKRAKRAVEDSLQAEMEAAAEAEAQAAEAAEAAEAAALEAAADAAEAARWEAQRREEALVRAQQSRALEERLRLEQSLENSVRLLESETTATTRRSSVTSNSAGLSLFDRTRDRLPPSSSPRSSPRLEPRRASLRGVPSPRSNRPPLQPGAHAPRDMASLERASGGRTPGKVAPRRPQPRSTSSHQPYVPPLRLREGASHDAANMPAHTRATFASTESSESPPHGAGANSSQRRSLAAELAEAEHVAEAERLRATLESPGPRPPPVLTSPAISDVLGAHIPMDAPPTRSTSAAATPNVLSTDGEGLCTLTVQMAGGKQKTMTMRVEVGTSVTLSFVSGSSFVMSMKECGRLGEAPVEL